MDIRQLASEAHQHRQSERSARQHREAVTFAAVASQRFEAWFDIPTIFKPSEPQLAYLEIDGLEFKAAKQYSEPWFYLAHKCSTCGYCVWENVRSLADIGRVLANPLAECSHCKVKPTAQPSPWYEELIEEIIQRIEN